MKKILFVAFAAALALASCGKDPQPDPEPQHNALYQTTWTSASSGSFDLNPGLTLSYNANGTIQFLTDSTGTMSLTVSASAMGQTMDGLDINDDCTYTLADNAGTIHATDNNIDFPYTLDGESTMTVSATILGQTLSLTFNKQ